MRDSEPNLTMRSFTKQINLFKNLKEIFYGIWFLRVLKTAGLYFHKCKKNAVNKITSVIVKYVELANIIAL